MDREFLELQTAKAWRLTPRQWRAESLDDRALMLSFEMFTGVCERYQREWYEGKGRKAEGGGQNGERKKFSAAEQFAAMRSGMGIK